MAVPAPKRKRIRTKEEIARAAKGNIPEFEFVASDGNIIVLEMLNRNGRVLITGDVHEQFVELHAERREKLAAAGAKEFKIQRIYDILGAVDDPPLSDVPETESGPIALYKTAAEKRAELFNEDQDAVLRELVQLVGCAALGARKYIELEGARIDREYYYEAVRMLVQVDDPEIPEEYHDEIAADFDSPTWRDQNYEDIKAFVDSFCGRVGL